MKQQIFASYVPSSYPNKADLPESHLPFRSAPNGPPTPNSRQHTFDETSFFNTAPQEHFSVPVSGGAEGSLDTWLMDIPAPSSPESSRMSVSPSQGIATPPSDTFYSPPYPEQLPVYAYDLPEQPQPLRSYSTSHPEWVDNAGNWQRNHSEGVLWGTPSFVAQPWTPNLYSGNAPSNVNQTHTSNAALASFMYPAQDHFPTSEVIQTNSAVEADEGSPSYEDLTDNEDTSDENSDSSEEEPDDNQAESSPSGSRLISNLGSARIQVDRWTIPVNSIQQSDTRIYVCNVPNCHTPFQRPEHLRRHVRSKHTDLRPFLCKVPACKKGFSRGDNLADHYWTHLERGGRSGVNKKMSLSELRVILMPGGKKIVRKLRDKLQKHAERERQKKLQVLRLAHPVRAML
ncbi:uncharacterized protein EKO05_0006811 [Ascochyta rabiei]|uniref:Metal ion binding n=1 Tax=Didymella rabiei TaxID=5454 RepID=A0A162V9K3_DIDRA|nr:uncharacterized protein EKO05_0006811 [Ascochyta rabiei]KZM18310.1 metal ion binding [Ascochyta rabiei]UPX16410.1 hypothetical protein EKO05_0006811 [Ascochyta rabiei]